MTNTGITSIIVCSIEWGKFEIWKWFNLHATKLNVLDETNFTYRLAVILCRWGHLCLRQHSNCPWGQRHEFLYICKKFHAFIQWIFIRDIYKNTALLTFMNLVAIDNWAYFRMYSMLTHNHGIHMWVSLTWRKSWVWKCAKSHYMRGLGFACNNKYQLTVGMRTHDTKFISFYLKLRSLLLITTIQMHMLFFGTISLLNKRRLSQSASTLHFNSPVGSLSTCKEV